LLNSQAAEIGDPIVVGCQGKGAPSAFERVGIAVTVEQGFGQPAIQLRGFRTGIVVVAKRAQTIVERAAVDCAREYRTIDR